MTPAPDKKNLLKRLFSRRAQKPGALELKHAQEMAKDKLVQKAVLKERSKNIRRRVLYPFLATTALASGMSATLQWSPDLVSTSLDDYMSKKGYTANYQQYFSASQIRVYDRASPLFPLHMAGFAVRTMWSNKEAPLLDRVIMAGPTYLAGLGFGISKKMTEDNPADPFAMRTFAPLETRESFILPPPEDFSTQGLLSKLAGLDTGKLHFKSDEKELDKVMFQFVLLHEARHSDQNVNASVAINENDLDRYALQVMALRGVKPEVMNEAMTLLVGARIFASTMNGDTSHNTGYSLQRAENSIWHTEEDSMNIAHLSRLLSYAAQENKDAFPKDMPGGERRVYLANGLVRSGLLDKDPELKRAAQTFLAVAGYFNQISEKRFINPHFDVSKLTFKTLTADYAPAPDKIGPIIARKNGAGAPKA